MTAFNNVNGQSVATFCYLLKIYICEVVCLSVCMSVCMFAHQSKTAQPIRTKFSTSLQRPTERVFAVKPSPCDLSFLQNKQTTCFFLADRRPFSSFPTCQDLAPSARGERNFTCQRCQLLARYNPLHAKEFHLRQVRTPRTISLFHLRQVRTPRTILKVACAWSHRRPAKRNRENRTGKEKTKW